MYLVFIDEAGNKSIPAEEIKSPSGGTTLYFTFAAVIVDMGTMHDIERFVQEVKNEYFVDRLTEAKFGIKKHALKPQFSIHDYRTKYAELIRDSGIQIVSVTINKYKAQEDEDANVHGMYKIGFRELLKSLREYQSMHSFAELAIIIDSINKSHDREIFVAYQMALESFIGQKGFYRKHFSPTIIFADSTFTAGLQIADFCASSIHRSVEADDPTYASIIKNRLFADKNGIQYGFGFKWFPRK